MNATVDLEVVPSVLKSGMIPVVPVYKGGGKDSPVPVHASPSLGKDLEVANVDIK